MTFAGTSVTIGHDALTLPAEAARVRRELGDLQHIVAPERVVPVVDVVLCTGDGHARLEQLANAGDAARIRFSLMFSGDERDVRVAKNGDARIFNKSDDLLRVSVVVKGERGALGGGDAVLIVIFNGLTG